MMIGGWALCRPAPLLAFGLTLLVGCAGGSPEAESTGSTTPTERLIAIQAHLPAMRQSLETLHADGVDIAYPLVRLTVLDEFSSVLQEDLALGGSGSTTGQIGELEQILDELNQEIDGIEAGERLPDVPRYVTSPIAIRDHAFWARVRWPDGTEQEDWPVIFNGYLPFDPVELLPDYGHNALTAMIEPAWILTSEEETDLTGLDEVLDLLDRAAQADVTLALQLSLHYLPDWAYETWPGIRKPVLESEFGILDEYIPFSVDSSEARALFERYLRAVIPEVADHPALHSLILTNEPAYFNAVLDPSNRPAYAAWLQEKYSDIDTLSEAHGRSYTSFEDAPIYPETGGDWFPEPEDDLRAQHDYYRFNDERFSGFHRWMTDIIHEMAPDVPVHTKMSEYVMDVAFDGIDPVMFDEFFQIAGNDSLKYYRADDPEEPYASDWLPQNKFFDLQRSISGKPIFNSEDHLVEDDARQAGGQFADIPPAHIRNGIWQSAIHGRAASTVWVWARSLDDEYTGEPILDFPGIANRPLAVAEHGRTALDLMRLGQEVHAFVTAPARVAIVYSAASLFYSYGFDGSQLYAWAQDGTYIALNFSGEKIDYITEGQLAADEAENYLLILAPGITHLPGEAADGLSAYAASGGRVVFVGESMALKDEGDRPLHNTFNGATLLPVLEPEELANLLRPMLADLPGGRSVVAKVADSGEEPWGVEWLHTRHDGRMLVNLTNYGKDSVTVRIDGLPVKGRVDLLTTKPVGDTVTIEPLATHLVAADVE